MRPLTRRLGWLPFLAALAVTLPALSGPFLQGDDVWVVERNAGLRSSEGEAILSLFDPTQDRRQLGAEFLPLRDLSYVLDHAVWGLDPLGFHLSNSLLYALTSLLLYLWLSSLTGNRRLACLAAFLFAVHPVHTESVCWISSRKDVLASFFLFASLLCFRCGWQCGRVARILFWGGSLGLGIAAMLSKSMAVVLPGMLLVSEWVFPVRPRSREDRRDLLFFVLGFGCVSIFLLQIHLLVGERDLVTPYAFDGWTRGATMTVVFLEYLRLVCFPISLGAMTDFPVYGLQSGWALVGLFVLGMTAIAGIVVVRRRTSPIGRVALFALLWAAVTILPFSNLVPFRHLLAERYLLLPSLSFCLLLAYFVEHRGAWRSFGVIGLAMVAMFLARAAEWGDPERHWEVALRRDPQNHFIHLLRGDWYAAEGRLEEADEAYRSALSHSSRSTPSSPGLARVGLGGIAIQLARRAGSNEAAGRFLQEAAEHYEVARMQDPTLAAAATGAASIERARGRPDRAIDLLLRAAAADPGQWSHAHDLGQIYALVGRPLRALDWYRRARVLNPSMTPLELLIARQEAACGRRDLARDRLGRLLRGLDPSSRLAQAAQIELERLSRGQEGR